MDPPRLDAQACWTCLHACTGSVLVDAANAGPERLLAMPDVGKVMQLTIDLFGLCEGQLAGPGVVLPFVNAGCEMHPAAVREHVANVVGQCVGYMRHQSADAEDERVLDFILQECREHLVQQAQAQAEEAERLRQQQQYLQQQQEEDDEYNRRHGQDFRFGTFKRTWREGELHYLAQLFADNPDLDWAAATRMLNAHYEGQMVDGVPFTERTADAVRYQVAKKNIMEVARQIRNERQGGQAGEGSSTGSTSRPA